MIAYILLVCFLSSWYTKVIELSIGCMCIYISIQFISLFGHIGPIQKDTHINIDAREQRRIELICSKEYIILSRDHAVHINSNIILISFLSHSSDDNKAAWLHARPVRSFYSTSKLSAYFRFIDIGELQKWAWYTSCKECSEPLNKLISYLNCLYYKWKKISTSIVW